MPKVPKQAFSAVLFDLDGTLVDTAQDMALALNLQRQQHDLEPLPYETIRPWVSHGAAALLKVGFELTPEHPEFESYRAEYLTIYAENLSVNTRLFEHLDELLELLEKSGVPWGIVTNKPEFLTTPLLFALQLNQRASVVVCGDTVKPCKPSPKPMFYACKQADILPNQTLYIGDADRDIMAGRLSGMTTIAAEYGYVQPEDDFANWGQDYSVSTPQELLAWFQKSLSNTG